jgi:hypothetical protein
LARHNVLEHVLELISRVGVRLSGEARLGEAEPGQPEQRRITGYALLQQRVDRPRARALTGRATGARPVLLP